MLLSADPLGFPMIAWPERQMRVALLPVLKVQIEQFIAEQNDYDDDWYEELLKLNPRISSHSTDTGQFLQDPRNLFITGIYPEEALVFLDWLGQKSTPRAHYDLATVEEWLALEKRLSSTALTKMDFSSYTDSAQYALKSLYNRYRNIYQRDAQLRNALPHWGNIAMLDDEFYELVHGTGEFVALGVPRTIYNPHIDPPRRLHEQQRSPAFGFRYVERENTLEDW